MNKAALYVRVSTDKQDELSPDAQIRLGRDYCEKNGLRLLPEHIYREQGISGRKADRRPQFLKMIADAKRPERPFDVILVWKFSRFARNQEESIVYKSLLRRQCGVEVVSISEPLMEGPFGSLIERIIEWMDEYYSIRLSGEVIRGMTEKALRNGYQITPPLGYRAVGSGRPFVIHEEEYKIVDAIFHMCDAQRMEPGAIARRLNEMGCRTRRKNLFEKRTVTKILRNPFYYGLVRWNGHAFMGAHETRLTKEQYDSRMKRMECPSPAVRSARPYRHWLSGMVKCPVCQAGLSYNASKRCPFFQCRNYSRGKHAQSVSISEKKLTQAVCASLQSLFEKSDLTYRYAPVQSRQDEAIHFCENALARLKTQEARIRQAYESGVDSLEEYRACKSRLTSEKNRLEAQLQSLCEKSKTPPAGAVLEKASDFCALLTNPSIPAEIKSQALHGILEKIVYDKENQKLFFYYSRTLADQTER